MKCGVPPTARKARTGEFTPPGITCLARSKSAAFVIVRGLERQARRRASVDVARILGRGQRLAFAARRRAIARLAFLVAFAFTRQGPEEAVGNDVAHPRPKARVERLVEERERLADGSVQLDPRREQRRERSRERLAGAD